MDIFAPSFAEKLMESHAVMAQVRIETALYYISGKENNCFVEYL